MSQQEILKRLPYAFKRYKRKAKLNGDNEFCQLIFELATQLGIRKAANTEFWNPTIDWLDQNHPGWRGYSVNYVWGQVA